MATKIAPASGIVAGNVGACDAAAAGSKTPRRSTCSTTAWPATVRTTPPSTTSTVSAQPDHAGRSVVPGQSSHQNAIIAMTGSANVESGPRTSSDRSAPPGGHGEEERHRYDEHQAGEPERGLPRRLGQGRGARDDRHAGSITSSGAIGSSRIRRPVAWKTALAIAAAVPTCPISPTPLAPSGPTSSS